MTADPGSRDVAGKKRNPERETTVGEEHSMHRKVKKTKKPFGDQLKLKIP